MKNMRKIVSSILATMLVVLSFSSVLMAAELETETLDETSEVIEEVEEEEVVEETSDETLADTSDETSNEDIVFENVEDEEETGFAANYETASDDLKADAQASTTYVSFKSGSCNSDVYYELYALASNPTVPVKATIYSLGGNGQMPDYTKGNSPFAYDTLKTVEFKNGVTYIGSNAFAYCVNLTDVKLPGTLTGIGSQAFYYCLSLKYVEFTSKLKSIGDRAFAYDPLIAVILTSGLDSMGEGVFSYCSEMQTAYIITNTKTLPADTFNGCSSMQLCCIYGSKLESCGKDALKGFYSNAEVTCPCSFKDAAKSYSYKFTFEHVYEGMVYSKCSGCSEIRVIKDYKINSTTYFKFEDTDGDTVFETVHLCGKGNTNDYSSTINPMYGEKGIKYVIVEDGIKYLGNYLFHGVRDLVSVELPSTLTSMGKGVFYSCSKLTTINIPEGITKISDYTFVGTGYLENLTLPNSLTEIGEYAFNGCGITSIEIPEGVTKIGASAFNQCAGLTEITIPANVASIPRYAFANSIHLKDIYFLSPSFTVDSTAFTSCFGLENIYVTCLNTTAEFPAESQSLVRVLHNYENACDTICNDCGNVRVPSQHVYDDDMDATCNVCGAVREIDPILAFATRLYTTCLGRSADKTGIDYWVKELKAGKSGAEAAYKFFFGKEFQDLKVSDDEYINRLYRTFMGREADNTGKTYWLGQIKNGSSRLDVFNGFVKSAEWKSICTKYGINPGEPIQLSTPAPTPTPVSGVEAFATRLYTTCLGRNPDAAGLKDWVAKLKSHKVTGTSAAHGFFFSKEFTSKNYSNDEYIRRLYRTFMGREADANGLAYWQGKFKSGYTREQVFQGFAKSAEFASICKEYGILV